MTGTRTRRRLARGNARPAVEPEERECLLAALLRDARRRTSLTAEEGNNILEHACVLEGRLDASVLKEVGKALMKVSGAGLTEEDFLT